MAAPATAAAAVPAQPFLRFAPAGVQAPLCRLNQKSSAKRFCPLPAEQCAFLHVRELDDEEKYVTARMEDPVAEAAAMRGVPFILYRLAPGEEAPFCLLRRTLEQHGHRWVRRGFAPRCAMLHWAISCPAESIRPLMRPDCRVLHFQHFTELTHKHRWQSGVRRQQAKLERIAASLLHSDDGTDADEANKLRARRLRHSLSFFPPTLLLPSDRLALLELHESLGGQVDPSLRAEALRPSAHTHKHVKKNRRSEAVGDVVIRNNTSVRGSANEAAAAAASPSASPSPSAADVASPSAGSAALIESDPSASPISIDAAVAEEEEDAPLWLQFDVPDFLASYPLHYALLDEQDKAAAAGAVRDPPIWILKPYSRGSGHGIRVTDLHANVDPHWITGQHVASRYIHRPLLIDITQKPPELTGSAAAASAAPVAAAAPDLRKFDLRLYAFLLSPFFPPAPAPGLGAAGEGTSDAKPRFPFQVFLHHGGLTRFASEPYDSSALLPDKLGLKMDAFIHLTNNAINASNEKKGEQQRGCWQNWSVDTLKQHFDAHKEKLTAKAAAASAAAGSAPAVDVSLGSSTCPYAWDWEYCWSQIRHVVVQSVCSSDAYLCSGLDAAHNAFHFELLGFDLLIDADFRVHLCEINSMPDLLDAAPYSQYQQTFPVDHAVKRRLLADVFNMLRFPRPDRADGADAAAGAESSDAAERASAHLPIEGDFERLI